mmetsp:Transcript_10787/g.15896  ORF Transcript_10787/g.15896 Transcript_10787/m.15896 type:complete len:167 (+) Transcript_10787:216-716(+)|eukprot:CAMPEP_0194229968 /NCGR_PEP_ID=MMETSP0156-20130528/44165_1 /TAXON_ID=33649 /ORGANISM="Thalassionema nitzschioides, Strain L26-B" /LENGTH=166 /DNA_ID=CAMNT_0038962535 /DNA_START=126 /DNA_END=626 /DNA_ORIENTATION=-
MTDIVATTEDGKNSKAFYCRHCGSKFMTEEQVDLVEHDQSRNHLQNLLAKENSDSVVECKKVTSISPHFWKVNDAFDFDNMGQTRGVGVDNAIVYVVCADCEKEPVGIRWSPSEPYYVSHSLVVYERPEGALEDGALPPGMSIDYLRGLIEAQKQQQNTEEASAEN